MTEWLLYDPCTLTISLAKCRSCLLRGRSRWRGPLRRATRCAAQSRSQSNLFPVKPRRDREGRRLSPLKKFTTCSNLLFYVPVTADLEDKIHFSSAIWYRITGVTDLEKCFQRGSLVCCENEAQMMFAVVRVVYVNEHLAPSAIGFLEANISQYWILWL